MRKFAAKVAFWATLIFVSAAHIEAQTFDHPKHLNRAETIKPTATCAGIICDLTPDSMTTPFTASQAVEMERAWQSQRHEKTAKVRPLPIARSHRRLAAVSSSDPAASEQMRIAIFSLFDPVIEPGDYGAWLRRVPRSTKALQAAVPTFAKKLET